MFFFFFFQAEDGIRDKLVTGVQTCALPISEREARLYLLYHQADGRCLLLFPNPARPDNRAPARQVVQVRSEERRVGKSVDLGGRRIIKKKKKKKKYNIPQYNQHCHYFN